MARLRRHRLGELLGALVALWLFLAPVCASAGTITQIDAIRARLNRVMRLLRDAQNQQDLLLADALKADVHATTALLRRCEAIMNGVAPDDTNFDVAVDLAKLPDPSFYTGAEVQAYTGAATVTVELEAAVEEQITTTEEMAQAVASFDLAASRVLGALNAGDLTSAIARLSELQTFLSLADTAVQSAIAGWVGLKSAMIDAGGNILFSQVDDEAYRQELINSGVAALPDDYSNELATYLGIDPDYFANTMLPAITGVPTASGDFLADIDLYTQALADVGSSLASTFSTMDAMVPEPSTGALVLLGLVVIAARRRSRAR